jgi:hypothetical protein
MAPHTAWPEMLLLAALLAASAGVFWWRFSRVLANIRHAKPDADLSFSQTSQRVRDFVFEVLLKT